MADNPVPNRKISSVAQRIVELLARQPNLRQSEIAAALGEHSSTVMRALPKLEAQGIRLAEDDEGRLSLAE
ncbi:MAG: MarR family transcriptional regulator [Anaerolineales bacterium]|nr:MarR family transcriptional regulator [Anaerolineales bacterium]